MEYIFKNHYGYFQGPFKTEEAAIAACKKSFSDHRSMKKVATHIYRVESVGIVTVQQVIEVKYPSKWPS